MTLANPSGHYRTSQSKRSLSPANSNGHYDTSQSKWTLRHQSIQVDTITPANSSGHNDTSQSNWTLSHHSTSKQYRQPLQKHFCLWYNIWCIKYEWRYITQCSATSFIRTA